MTQPERLLLLVMQLLKLGNMWQKTGVPSPHIRNKGGKRFSFGKMACMDIEFRRTNRKMGINEESGIRSKGETRQKTTGVRDGTANSAK